jgi:AcrR family transcriptional regulator
MNTVKPKIVKPKRGTAEKNQSARKPSDSKARILAAATRQFADRGFEGVVIRDIAKAADVTLPTIYHFFGDKRKLYEQTCIEIFEKQNAVLQEALRAADDPATRLWRFTAQLLSILIEDNEFARLLQRELLEQDHSLIDDHVRLSLQPHFKMLSAAVTEITGKQDSLDRSIAIYSLAYGLSTLRPIWQVLNGKKPVKLKTPLATTKLVLSLAIPEIDWDAPKPAPGGAKQKEKQLLF